MPFEITLTLALTDFATSRMALALGDTAMARELTRRSGNWRNTFPYDATDSGFTGYSDIHGGFGGDVETQKTCQYFNPSNQPDVQVPWQYNWVGAPHKAQRVVRDVITTQYKNSTDGIPGNNDWGSMSAWYLQATMGLYPEIQGVGGWAVTSPLFAKLELTLENGRTLTIEAANASRTNQYIQSATINGTDYDSPWIPYEELVNDNSENTLRFVLGESPSDWGSDPTVNPPPSFPGAGTAPVGTTEAHIR